MEVYKTSPPLEKEVAELRLKLDEANDTIEAIRSGQIDALIVKSETGHQLYTLKSSDQTYRVFIEKMNEGAITLNRNGTIVYSNSRFATMLNLTLPEVIGTTFETFAAPEYQNALSLLIQQGWETESKGETCLLNKYNNGLPFLISLTALQLDEGTALSIILTDLSVQKQTEKQLKSKHEQLLQAHNSLTTLNSELEYRVAKRTHQLSLSREHFKFLADNIPVIVWTANPNGDIDYFNKKWYEYTGNSLGSTNDFEWQKVIHPDDLQVTTDAWADSVKTARDYFVEYRFLRASDNTYRSHVGTAFPFKDSAGEIIKWFGICTDIEEQKMAMNKKDEFISVASHELKTPITTLKAFTQILLSTFEKENNSKAVDYLSRMDKQIDKLTRLITELLNATKINAGVMDFEKELFDFNELVLEEVKQIQLTSDTHSIEMDLSRTHTIFGDRNRLAQVINNLISNAIKYSPQANKIIVRTIEIHERLKLSVEDFGIGIPTDQHSKLFNRFFRASEVETNTFPGLGLGLYISNEIVKRHSGQLTFTSEEGKGSTFCVELPLKSIYD